MSKKYIIRGNGTKVPTASFWLATVMVLSPLLLGAILALFLDESAGVLWFTFIFAASLIGIIASSVAIMKNKGKPLRGLLILYIVWLAYQIAMSIYAMVVSGAGFMG